MSRSYQNERPAGQRAKTTQGSCMAKLKVYGCTMLLLLMMSNLRSTAQYFLRVIPQDKDTLFHVSKLGLETSFKSQAACMEYISRIPATLQAKGYMTVSVDSLVFDEKAATIHLFVGELYRWATAKVIQDDQGLTFQVVEQFDVRPVQL